MSTEERIKDLQQCNLSRKEAEAQANAEVNSKSRLHRIAVQKGEPVTRSVSFAPEVVADSTGKFYGNALRFATREEAEANVAALASRWMMVRETRVVESNDPVNFRWQDGQLVAVTK